MTHAYTGPARTPKLLNIVDDYTSRIILAHPAFITASQMEPGPDREAAFNRYAERIRSIIKAAVMETELLLTEDLRAKTAQKAEANRFFGKFHRR